VFQEIDQVAIMKGCVKWADRAYNLKRIPEQVNNAFQHAMSGKPGPTYLDFPGDLLYAKIEEDQVDWSMSGRPILNARPMGDPEQVDGLILALSRAQEARHHLGQRRDLVTRLERDAAARRKGRHSLLHDAARPRRGAG
jgi:thiamine pyrophosphate-dependent acetolactate synthase large subunit-like protein